MNIQLTLNKIQFEEKLTALPILVFPKEVLLKTGILVGELIGLICENKGKIINTLVFKVGYCSHNENKFLMGIEYKETIENCDRIIIKPIQKINLDEEEVAFLVLQNIPQDKKKFF